MDWSAEAVKKNIFKPSFIKFHEPTIDITSIICYNISIFVEVTPEMFFDMQITYRSQGENNELL